MSKSLEHLTNCRKIVDEMAMHSARLSGLYEALRLLYAEEIDGQTLMDIDRSCKGYTSAGLPLAITLSRVSEHLENEIKKIEPGRKE